MTGSIELVLIGLDHRVKDVRQELVQPTCFPCVLPHPRERDIGLARVAEQIAQRRQRERGHRMESQHLSQITRGQECRSRALGVARQLPAGEPGSNHEDMVGAMALLVALQGEPVDLGVADAALATRFAIDHRGVGLLTEWGYRQHIGIPRSAPPLGAEPEVGEGLRERHLKARRILARGRRLDQPLGK